MIPELTAVIILPVLLILLTGFPVILSLRQFWRSARGSRSVWKEMAVTAAIVSVLAAGQARANGINPTVVEGQASFSALGSSLNVTNSPGAIINWQGFSIGAGETTRFIQQNAASSILNRVLGSDPSVILGTLISNGKVFLINPSGILFGQGAHIDVAGLVASSLDLSNQDFLSGKLNFTSNLLAGRVENQGSITTPSGGSVYLIGTNVTNSGIINSPSGDVILAAGQTVKIFDTSSPGVRIELTAGDNSAVNLGKILAQSGEVGIYGAALRNSGIINADQVARDGNGRITLRAKQDVTLETGSRISANGEKGGEITVQSDTGTTLVSGSIEAKGTGETAGTGGSVQLLGTRVGLITANIDASGTTGGGTVLIGGNFHGTGSEQNASATYVAPGASINADATGNGNGGNIALWSQDVTRVYGSVSARGGAEGGNGGFVETSSHNQLDVTGMRLDLRAPLGQGGNWLIDPYDVMITGTNTNIDIPTGPVFTPNATGANIDVATIVGQLNGGASVTITTAAANGSGLEAGDITLVPAISKTTGGDASLTMIAAGKIETTGAISSTLNKLNVTLRANDNTAGQNDQNTAWGSVVVTGAIDTLGGTFQSSGINFSNAGIITTTGGNVTLTHTGNVTVGAAINAGAGNATIIGNSIVKGTAASTLTAATANLVANTTIGVGGVGAIETNVGTGTLNAVAGGNIVILEADAVTLGTVSSGGSITITNSAAGNITLGTVAGGIVTAASTVNIAAAAGNIVDGTGGLFTNISVDTGHAVTLSAAALTGIHVATNTPGTYSPAAGVTEVTDANIGAVTSVGGVLRIYSPGNLTASGTITAGGDAQLNAPGYVTVNGIATTTGAFTATAGGALTLGGTISANGTGNAVVLAGSSFINSAGASAITTPGGGRWLVYSSAPSADTFDLLSSGNLALWNKTYAGYPPASVSESGNRYLFANQPALTVTADANTKVYGDAVVLTSTVTGLVNAASYDGVFTQDASIGTPSLTSPGTVLTAGVSGSPYTITTTPGSFEAPAGYNLTSYVNGLLSVDARPITVTVADQSRYYGSANPTTGTITGTVGGSGFVFGDSISALNVTAPSVAGTAHALTSGALVGSGPTFTAGGGSGSLSSDYAFTILDGALSVAARPISVAANAGQTKIYGGADPALAYSVSAGNLVNGDAFTLTRLAGENVGGYAISLTPNTNYTISYTGANFDITPAALTVAANSQSKVYGTSDPTLTFGITGLVNNPALAIADTAGTVLSGVLTRSSGESVAGGPYAITQGTLAANSNYTLNSFTGNDLIITPAALTVAANPQNKLFGTSDPALTYTVTGLVNNPALGITDTAPAVLSGELTRVPGESALGGPYRINQGSLTANSNYTTGFTGNNLIITGAAAEPILGFNAGQVIFAGVINNEFYYRPGNFWHISLNPNNADPGFDVMRGTNDLNARLSKRAERCDSVFGGGMCESWSFPQQLEKVKGKK